VLTAATAGAELAHVTVRPVSTAPLASFSVAVACAVPPTTSDDADNATLTLATGTGDTVSPSDPLTPSLVAVMTTAPAATAVTSPLAETIATAVLDEVQPTVRPLRTFPDASFNVMVICNVSPTVNDVELAVRVTVATGAGAGAATVTVAAPLCPSMVAITDADPAFTAVTVPVAETVATSGLALDHVTVRPVRMLPAASRRVAVA
jgi:hypothetical protein